MGKSAKRDLDSTVEVVEVVADVSMSTEEPKLKKSKKSKTTEGEEAEAESKEIPKEALSAIAKPLAGKKVGKHVLKLVKKGQFSFLLSHILVIASVRSFQPLAIELSRFRILDEILW